MASAKYIITNSNLDYGVTPKEGQVFLQTWHGTPLKKLRCDIEAREGNALNSLEEIRSKNDLDVVRYDYFIAPSSFAAERFASAFRLKQLGMEQILIQTGYPRNDLLQHFDEAFVRDQKERLGIPGDKKVILYAPTFRDARNLDCYDLDYNRVIAAAEARFGGKWKIINRYHFKVAKKLAGVKAIKNNPNILSGNSYDDIQELMAVCDIGITDYSSWICDFVLTGRPGFIYANDLQAYDKERGFYYPLDSTPFPIAENNDQLESNILDFDADKYAADKEEFLKARGSKEDGRAAERVVSLLKRYMKEKKHKKED